MTKQIYINEIENLTKKLYSYYEKKYISNGRGDFNGFFEAKKPVDDIWGNILTVVYISIAELKKVS